MLTLEEALERLRAARKRWCAQDVDDPEEMWVEVPEMLDEVVPALEAAIGDAKFAAGLLRTVALNRGQSLDVQASGVRGYLEYSAR